MILIDTNIIIEVLKKNYHIRNELSIIGQQNLATSVICVAEIYFGVLNGKELTAIEKDLSLFKIFHIEPAVSMLALQLTKQYILAHKVGISDFLIAATCLHNDVPIYTLNKKDFRFIPGLKFYN